MKPAKRILEKAKSADTQILNKVIADAVFYFNYFRSLRKLKGKTPVQYRIELAS